MSRRWGLFRIAGLLITLLFFAGHWSWCHANEWGYVDRVDDGDTVVLADGRRIRYLGINAPEIQHGGKSSEPFGRVAMRFNRDLALHQKIRLEYDAERQDAYGRDLAYLFLSNGIFVNAEIVRHGYAHCLPSALNKRYETLLLLAQREAMQQGRGIWQKMKKSFERLVGNMNSKRFHRPGCQAARNMRKTNQLFFYGKWNAFWNGYAPCRQCLP